MYDAGEGVKRNDVEAVRWYTKAAEQNHPEALYMLVHICIKRHAHKTLRRQIINFIRHDARHHVNARRLVGQIVFNQMQIGIFFNPKRFNPPKINRAGAAIRAVHFIPFCQQQLGQIRAVLPCNARNDYFFIIIP
jgi:hypothetical protein